MVQSLNSLFGWSQLQERGTGIGWRIVKSLLSNCPKRPVFGSHWWTRHSMVSKQTCSICHKMDRSLWQTFQLVWFLKFIAKWPPTKVSYGKHGSALSMRFIPRLRFCWRLGRLKINTVVNLMYLWKSNTCCYQLDVQETNVDIPQFHRIRNCFVGCGFANGWNPCSWLLRRGDQGVTGV